jgi:GDPmannose 4,6-dehydratase
MKVALITGVTGQDGSYLSELLLDKGYIVWGIIRRCSNINTQRINHIFDKLILRYGDLSDGMGILNVITEIKNKYNDELTIFEVYNAAAMSHVKISFEIPEFAGNIDGLGTLRILESLRISGIPLNKIKFYQCSSSELFGKVQEVPQKETTPSI